MRSKIYIGSLCFVFIFGICCDLKQVAVTFTLFNEEYGGFWLLLLSGAPCWYMLLYASFLWCFIWVINVFKNVFLAC